MSQIGFMGRGARANAFPSSKGLAVASLILLVASPVIQSKGHAQAVNLDEGLEAYWTFDEGAGEVAGDSSGNGRGLEIFDAPEFADSMILWTEGRFGSAVDFDLTYFLASPEYYGIGGTEPRTVAAWIRTDWEPTGGNALVGWGPNIPQQRWHFKLEGSTGGIRTENQGGNNLAGIPVNDGEWHHVVSVFPEGGQVIGDVDHYVDGVFDSTKTGGVTNPVDTNIDPAVANPVTVGGSPFDASLRYAMAVMDEVRIYNRALSAEEIAALAAGEGVKSGAPPSIALANGVKDAPFYDPSAGVQLTISSFGESTLEENQVAMEVNGVDVTADLVISGTPSELTVEYNGLESNLSYTVTVTATDSLGRAASRQFGFSTFDQDSFLIEAENYNFQGGQFFDDVVLCNTFGSESNCYFDRISLPGVDAFDSSGNSDDTQAFENVYRYSASDPNREEEFDTNISGDILRDKYVGVTGATGPVMDYDINLLSAGDWANYTRTFPEDSRFAIYLRARAGAAQQARLDRVLGGADSADQELSLIGFFNVPASAGYNFVPLTDASGENVLTVNLSGLETIRMTASEAANDIAINFLMFAPATETIILPTVSIQSPAEGEVFPSGGDVTLRAEADDLDGSVVRVRYLLRTGGEPSLIGEATESPYEVVWSNVAAGRHVVFAEAVDNDGLAALSTTLTIVVDSEPPSVSALRGSPALNEIEIIFNETLDAAVAENVSNYSIEPALSIASATVSGRRVVLSTAPQSEGTDYTVTLNGIEDANGIAMPEASETFTASSSNLLYGLELYWTFDDGSGGVARDVSGYARDAAIYDVAAFESAAIGWGEGQFGGGIDFDGGYFLAAPDYYGIGGVEPRTISMWIRTDWVPPNGNNALLGWGNNANTERWHFKLENTNNGALRTENQGGNNFGEVPVNDGQWHHVAAVFPEFGFAVGDVNHYVDGVLDAAKNGGVGNPVNTSVDPAVAAPVTVGGAPLGVGGTLRAVVALLDDVRLYNRALTESEIQALANGEGVLEGPSGPAAGPRIEVALNADQTVTLLWEGVGALQRVDALGDTWMDVGDGESPYTEAVEGDAFFRVIMP